MSCELVPTTLAWAFQEADDGHALHIAGCAVCQEALEQLEVAASVALPRPVVRSRRWANVGWTASAVALAAAVVAFVALQRSPVVEPAPLEVVAAPFETALDRELDALDADLDAFSTDLQTL